MRMLFGWFWSTSARNLRSRLTVAFAKCHFEVSEFKKYFIYYQYIMSNFHSFECRHDIVYRTTRCISFSFWPAVNFASLLLNEHIHGVRDWFIIYCILHRKKTLEKLQQINFSSLKVRTHLMKRCLQSFDVLWKKCTPLIIASSLRKWAPQRRLFNFQNKQQFDLENRGVGSIFRNLYYR
jgi:hypothetical protein